MSRSHWLPYPPCSSFAPSSGLSCETPQCCSGYLKFSWPELVGKNGNDAKATIERDNTEVTVVMVRPGEGRIDDFCCNRVYVQVDGNGIVTTTPLVG